MKKLIIPIAMAGIMMLSATAKRNPQNGPVLMTVNGKDVPVSEFVYYYEKNNQQQANPQSLDEYLDLFVNYKLKVAAAEEAGIDTTAAFMAEFGKYTDDLAAPFLSDTTVLEPLRRSMWNHMNSTRKVRHIMMPLGATPEEYLQNRLRLDSIRNLIVNENADFSGMARRFSSDRSAMQNGGEMGWIRGGRLPHPFEDMAYATEVGTVSPVFEDAPYGYHIIEVLAEQPDTQVLTRHILLMTRNLDAEAAAAVETKIDSLYNVLASGEAQFAQVAADLSQDPGSARNGGLLPWFGRGEMVPEFEEVAFTLAPGQLSKPFSTSYGYHIIYKENQRVGVPYEEALPRINMTLKRDGRETSAPREARLQAYRAQNNILINPNMLRKAHDVLNTANLKVDSTIWNNLERKNIVLAKIGDRKFTPRDVIAAFPAEVPLNMSSAAAIDLFDRTAEAALNTAVAEYIKENLIETDPSFRNLVNEYRDGILLFDISNSTVWNRSNTDPEGLEAFFQANRDRYVWRAPKAKVIVVSATSDSISTLAAQWLKDNPVGLDSIVTKLREQFGRGVKVERKIMAKGEDAVVDYLCFGGDKPAPQGRWTDFFAYQQKILEAPEEAIDVRGEVVVDYQQWLEQQWLEQLHERYPVVINQRELQRLRTAR